MKISMRALILVLAVSTILGGCAGMQTQQVESKEQLLSAAGFQMKYADTPQKQAHIQTLPQHTLLTVPYKGRVVYVYRDVNTLYMGDQAAYQSYQKLAMEKKIATEQLMAAEINEASEAQWGMWGWY